MSLLAVVFEDLPAGLLQFCAVVFEAGKNLEGVGDIVTAETGGVDTARGVFFFRARFGLLFSRSKLRRSREQKKKKSRTNSNDHCHEARIH